MKLDIGKRVKTMIKNWLEITPAQQQIFTLQGTRTFEAEVMQAKIWYRGDSEELSQFFENLNRLGRKTAFWETAPRDKRIRRIHSGIPAIIADTLAYIVVSDLDKTDADCEGWERIANTMLFNDIVKKGVIGALVCGDGAFKISVDKSLSELPIVEFIDGDRVEFEYRRGILYEIVFKSAWNVGARKYTLCEHYGKGYIESRLYNENDKEIPLSAVPALADIEPNVVFDGDYFMAVPLRFYDSPKFENRGRSIFSGGRSDCFDALDEIVSLWWDAVRAGRVKQYIPESFIPRNPENGSLLPFDAFGNEYITVNPPITEGVDNQRITTVQPDIKYEAFVTSYTNALLMCLQGLISPATLGIDVGKMSSADAQREKKDVTGSTRNVITGALETALPELISAILKTCDNMREKTPRDYDASVSFGEYGAPDFDSRVETVGKAAQFGIMSVEKQVDELWGSSLDDEEKAAEVGRIKAEKGIADVSEPTFSEV